MTKLEQLGMPEEEFAKQKKKKERGVKKEKNKGDKGDRAKKQGTTLLKSSSVYNN